MKEREIKGWAKNIAENYNCDIDTDIFSQLIDACKSLEISIDETDQRWQFFIPGFDQVSCKDIMYLLGV